MDSRKKLFERSGKIYQWDYTGTSKNLFFFRIITFCENHFPWNFFWTTLFSDWIQTTEDRKVNSIMWRKHLFHWSLFSLKRFACFCIIHHWGYIRIKIKRIIIRKNCFCSVSFFTKKTLTLLWVGLQSSQDKKNSFLKLFFSQKTILSKKLFEKFVIKDQWAQKKDESN